MAAAVLLACFATAPEAASPDIKPAIRGLISMGAYRFVARGGDPVNTLDPLDAKPGIFSGLVVVATWSELQPNPGAELGDDNAIDRALDAVRAYNARNPQKPLAVKLRVWAGFAAPDWAKAIGGDPIDVVHNDKPRVLGRFWSEPYRKAFAAFQEQLAARYDGEPLIREVAITSCMSVTAEPFYVPLEDTLQAPIRAAGFNDADYRSCLEGALADYAPWKASRLVLSVNSYGTVSGEPNDPGFTIGVMHACRKAIGARCVLDNHDLDATPPESILPIFAAMRKLGPEIEFQTFHETPDDFDGTIARGVALGATAIELWQDFHGFPLVDDDDLKRWAAMLEANAPAGQ